MWGRIDPQWKLLKSQLEAKGPGRYSVSEREERLFTNRSTRPGDDMKEELRSDGDHAAWQAWLTAQQQLWRLRQPGPPVAFPGDSDLFADMYTQVREEEQAISLSFTQNQQEASTRRRNKRKQAEDGGVAA